MYVRDCSNKIGMDEFHIRVASQGREKDSKLVERAADVAPMKRPSVLVVTRRTIRKNKYIDYVGEYHLALLIRLGILPVMVPVVEGALACLPDYMAGMKGLLLVEGEDIEPRQYKATPENFKYVEKDASAEGRDRNQLHPPRLAAKNCRSWEFAAARNCSMWSAEERSTAMCRKKRSRA